MKYSDIYIHPDPSCPSLIKPSILSYVGRETVGIELEHVGGGKFVGQLLDSGLHVSRVARAREDKGTLRWTASRRKKDTSGSQHVALLDAS